MNKVLEGVQFKDIITPEETYVLYPNQIDCALSLFTVKTDDEILTAVKIHAAILADFGDILEQYLGIKKVNKPLHHEDTYEIKLRCRETDTGELRTKTLILERLQSLQAEYQRVKSYLPLD